MARRSAEGKAETIRGSRLDLYRVMVMGPNSEVYDERFVLAANEDEAFRYGVGKGLTDFAYENCDLGWTTMPVAESHWMKESLHEAGVMNRLFDACHRAKPNVPFVIDGLAMETEPVPSDKQLRVDYPDSEVEY